MTDAAEKTIDVQYYIFQEDDTGKLLTDAILSAADRGVRVRVLLDDVDVSGRDKQIITLGGHSRIEIRLFNPFAYRGGNPLLRAVEFTLNAPRLNRRMHNKLFVVDNAAAIVGGRNIGDEYFQTAPRDVEFGDYDVFAAGPIVKKLSETFDAYGTAPSRFLLRHSPGKIPRRPGSRNTARRSTSIATRCGRRIT
jgi:putative cardiolipin synthase